MRRLIALIAIVLAAIAVPSAASKVERSAAGYIHWGCAATTSYGYVHGVNCTATAYQQYVGKIYGPVTAGSGSFYAPGSGPVTMYASACGSTKTGSSYPNGPFIRFHWSNC